MPSALPDLPYAADHVVSAAGLHAHGIGSHEVARLVRSGVLHRLFTGWYSTRAPADLVDRHGLQSLAVLRHLGGRAALSHQSRVLLAGLPLWRAPLERVHVTRLDDSVTRRRPHLVSHAQVPGLVVATTELGPVVPLAVALVQTGLAAGALDAAVAADAALHRGLVSTHQLDDAVALLAGHRGVRRVAAALRRSDARHESPGETRLAHLFADARIPVTPQFEVMTRLGLRRADFRVDGTRVLVEFDGRVKYTDPARSGDVLWREKRRQDALEDEGWIVVRVSWSDLVDPGALLARVRAAMSRSARRLPTTGVTQRQDTHDLPPAASSHLASSKPP